MLGNIIPHINTYESDILYEDRRLIAVQESGIVSLLFIKRILFHDMKEEIVAYISNVYLR